MWARFVWFSSVGTEGQGVSKSLALPTNDFPQRHMIPPKRCILFKACRRRVSRMKDLVCASPRS